MGIFEKYRLRKRWSAGKTRKKHAEGWFRAVMERSHAVKALIAVSGCAGTVGIILIGQVRSQEGMDLYVGQPAPRDVFADMGFAYENREETQKLKQETAQKVFPHYSLSPDKLKQAGRQIREALGFAVEAPDASAAGGAEKMPEPEQVKAPIFKPSELDPLKNTSTPGKLAAEMEAFLNQLGGKDAQVIKDADKNAQSIESSKGSDRYRLALQNAAGSEIGKWTSGKFPRDRRMREAVADALNIAADRSIEYDEDLTQAMREKASAKVQPVISRVQAGGKIVEKGYELTPRQMDMYKAYIAQREEVEPPAVKMRERLYYILGLTLLTVMFIIVARRYLMFYQEQAYRSNSSLFMLECILLGSLLLARGISIIPFGTIQSGWNNIFYYLVVAAVPMAAMLMTLLLNRAMALFFAVWLGIFVGIITGFNLSYMIVAVLGGIVAIYSTVGVRSRNQLIKVGFTVALANIITIGALDAIANFNIVSATVGFRVAGGILCGFISVFLAASFLPILEHAFNVVTDIRWLELSDLNHPLLKRMFIEAPGTYHHSLMVGNLAEAAAEAIGANPLQARVCAYFHDIGKLNKPDYFTENEPYEKSMHKKLRPRMSNLIILAHVKDGVDMAVTNKLNGKIVETIRQHHGTGLVYFFYRLAEETKARDEKISQEDFRYSGPKPQDKETAIILLADAVEAASRSLGRPTPSRVRSLVREIINQRIIDGQLDESELTFNDLRLIGERFEHILNSTFHARIKYPAINSAVEQEEGHDEGPGEEPAQKVQA